MEAVAPARLRAAPPFSVAANSPRASALALALMGAEPVVALEEENL